MSVWRVMGTETEYGIKSPHCEANEQAKTPVLR